ncbi:MAG: WbqC family protein [Bacteroidales bacterium]|nr:WbqC family protein [Bacteroidales bacterium]
MKTTLLSTAYLPPIEYILKCMQGPVTLEVCEHYIKQSYRNRALIATANGIQVLSIPVVHVSSKMPILDVRIDFATPWQRLHWKSIDTAYSGSPYFLYFQDYIRPFYEKKFDFLFDFNLELTQVILKLFGKDFQPQQTKEFIADYTQRKCGEQEYSTAEVDRGPQNDSKQWEEIEDLRNIIHPKRCREASYPFPHKPYTQIFEDRLGFVPNLSIVDFLFNEGNRIINN